MEVKQIVNSVLNSNTYILYDNYNKDAWLVDAGDADIIIKWCNNNGKTLCGVFLTHTHVDHIYGLNALIDFFPKMKVYTCIAGKKGLYSDKYNFSKYLGNPFVYKGDNLILIDDSDNINLFDNVIIKVIATPGHDESCLSYVCGDFIFSGDSYIPGLKVVTTFPFSDKQKSLTSEKKILSFPNIKYIYPGHGDCVKKI